MPPSQPLDLEIVSVFATSVNLTWKLPALNGGDTISGYIVERCLPGGEEWIRFNVAPIKNTKADVFPSLLDIYTDNWTDYFYCR